MWSLDAEDDGSAPPPWAQPWNAKEDEYDAEDQRHDPSYTMDMEGTPSTSYDAMPRVSTRYRSPSVAKEHLYRFQPDSALGAGPYLPESADKSGRVRGSHVGVEEREGEEGEEGACVPACRRSEDTFVPSAPSLASPSSEQGPPPSTSGVDPSARSSRLRMKGEPKDTHARHGHAGGYVEDSPASYRFKTTSTNLEGKKDEGEGRIQQPYEEHDLPMQGNGNTSSGLSLPAERQGRRRDGVGKQSSSGSSQRTIGLNPLQENATLRLLTYEACLRLCFTCMNESPVIKVFLENGFQVLQNGFGVDKLILQPLSKHHQGRKGNSAMSAQTTDRGAVRSQQQMKTSIHLNLEFTGMKSLGKKSASSSSSSANSSSSSNAFFHSLGKKLRSTTGKSKSLYCHVRLSSRVGEEYHISKIGSHNAISLEVFSADSSSTEGQNRYSAEDVLEIVLKDKQDVSIGYASMPVPSTIDAEVHGTTQIHNLPVRSQQGDIIGSLAMTSTIEKKVSRKEADSAVDEDLKSNGLEFDANRAYDLLLQVALSANHFKQRHLLITKPWHFLLNKFASEYNISTTTCILQFLKWVVRASTPTSECMDILCQLLPRLLKEKHQADLPVAEQNMLSQMLQKVEELLAKSFQCIKSLSEKEINGVLTGYQIVPKENFPSPVIPKVLFLYSQMHDLLAPSSQKKLVMHLQAAANLRFGRIKRDAIDSCAGEQRVVGEGIDCLAASKIFDTLRVELEYDQMLHQSGVLPTFVDFPTISNEVYAEKLYEHLKELLVTNPPTDFSDALDSLFRSASLYETAQSKFSLSTPKEKSVFVLFSDHVETWIRRDCTWLCAKLTHKELSQEILDIERALGNYHFSGHADSHPPHQSPYQLYLIPIFKSGGVFDKIQGFLSKYTGIVKRWPAWVPVLERSCCKILRALLASLNEACSAAKGSVVQQQHKNTPVKMLRCKNNATFTTRLAISEAVLLNAIRQMLSFTPKLRSSVSGLASGIPIQKETFKNGTMFRHVEEEVRTSYAQTIQKCVISLSEAPCHKLKKILKGQSKIKLNECEGDNVKDLLKPYLALIDTILSDHRVMLTPKVWRDLCRGMWDLAAAEVLKFVERIHNDKENTVGFHVRVMTSEVSTILEGFFQQGLHQVLGSDVHEKDLQTPFSAKKLRERICAGNRDLSASDSFSVY